MRGERKEIGQCALCGEIAELTFEHVPPKAAFNDRGTLFADFKHYLDEGMKGDPRAMRQRKAPKGAGAYTLCERCNTSTGNWYVPAYVDWAAQGMVYRKAAPTGSSLRLPFHIFPARVAKQIFCMFASACGPGFFDANHELRRFVLNRDHRGVPEGFRLYAFIMGQKSRASRQAGITGLITGDLLKSARIHTFAEISYPPFGYILTIDSLPEDNGLADITFFARYGFREFPELHLRLPVREVNSYFPGDFRDEKAWDQAIENSLSEEPGAE